LILAKTVKAYIVHIRRYKYNAYLNKETHCIPDTGGIFIPPWTTPPFQESITPLFQLLCTLGQPLQSADDVIQSIQLDRRVTSSSGVVQDNTIVSVSYIRATGHGNVTNWADSTIQARAEAYGDVLNNTDGYLSLA
jgi:hypothetical protein